jgi:thiol-disulfide isomerase/thioredoxin
MISVINLYKKNKVIRILSQTLFVLLIIFLIRAWQARHHIQGDAPVIVANTLQGELFDLREHQSKPVLVHFWATWCPICQFENANIENLSKDYQVITIASWSEGETEVRDFLKSENINMPVIVDEDGEWANVYGVKAVPASFVIDAQGIIQFIETGYTSEMGLRMRLWWLND